MAIQHHSQRHPLYTNRVNADSCSCPIHEAGEPSSLPLGVEFGHRVSVADISREEAGRIYEAHHSYCPNVPGCTNICHHGIYHDDELMGAITWNQPLYNGPKFGVESDGTLTREYDDAVGTFITDAGGFMQAARICIGVEFQNLASCGLARSMEVVLDEHVDRLDIEWLLTFIREDHVGSMLKALYDKGWQWVGMTRPKAPPGNRESEDIHKWRKQRWVYPIVDYRRYLNPDERTQVAPPQCAELKTNTQTTIQ